MRVGIIGLGYVGLPLAIAFAEEGHEVIGLDVDSRKVEAIRDGRSYVEDVPSKRLAACEAVCVRRPATRTSPTARRWCRCSHLALQMSFA